MAEIWKPLEISVYQDWIRAILDQAQDDLNSWEAGFVQGLDDLLDNGRNLSQRQAQVLERIYAQKTK
jgi:uncharacterized protein YmfQ (DUF2313 family)